MKTCSCGKVYRQVPEFAQFFLDSGEGGSMTGWYWDCECKSSCFKPFHVSGQSHSDLEMHLVVALHNVCESVRLLDEGGYPDSEAKEVLSAVNLIQKQLRRRAA